MDLFAIAASMWRHKIVTIPIVILTIIGMFYILVVEPPVYQAQASILLANPKASPSTVQITADPKLAQVNTNNPYASLGNLDLVADVLIEVLGSPSAKHALENQGVDPNYQLKLDVSYGSPPAINITGVGSTASAATTSAQLVATAISSDLRQLQLAQHVNTAYLIPAIEYIQPTSATPTSSGKLRTLIGVVGAGFIVLLLGVSIAQSVAVRRKRSAAEPAVSADYGDGEDDYQAREYAKSARHSPAREYQAGAERRDVVRAPETWSATRNDLPVDSPGRRPW